MCCHQFYTSAKLSGTVLIADAEAFEYYICINVTSWFTANCSYKRSNKWSLVLAIASREPCSFHHIGASALLLIVMSSREYYSRHQTNREFFASKLTTSRPDILQFWQWCSTSTPYLHDPFPWCVTNAQFSVVTLYWYRHHPVGHKVYQSYLHLRVLAMMAKY